MAGVLLGIAVTIRADKPLAELNARYATPASQFMPVGGMSVQYRDESPRQDSVLICAAARHGSRTDGRIVRIAQTFLNQ